MAGSPRPELHRTTSASRAMMQDSRSSPQGGMRRVSLESGELGRGAARTGHAPVSYQTARTSFKLHVCAMWMRMPCTALEVELPDSSEQKTRLVVRDDPPLHAERVERPSITGCILHSLGSGQ